MGLGKKLGVVVLSGGLLVGGFGTGVVNNLGSGDRVVGVSEASALAFEDLYPRDAIAERESNIKKAEYRMSDFKGKIKELRASKVVETKRLKDAQFRTKASYKQYKDVEAREKRLGKRGNAKKVVEYRVVYETKKREETKIRDGMKQLDVKISNYNKTITSDMKNIYKWKKEISAIKKKHKIK